VSKVLNEAVLLLVNDAGRKLVNNVVLFLVNRVAN